MLYALEDLVNKLLPGFTTHLTACTLLGNCLSGRGAQKLNDL
jgi:hypothetical protein